MYLVNSCGRCQGVNPSRWGWSKRKWARLDCLIRRHRRFPLSLPAQLWPCPPCLQFLPLSRGEKCSPGELHPLLTSSISPHNCDDGWPDQTGIVICSYVRIAFLRCYDFFWKTLKPVGKKHLLSDFNKKHTTRTAIKFSTRYIDCKFKIIHMVNAH